MGHVFYSKTLKLKSENGRFVALALNCSTKVSDSLTLLNISSVKVEKLSPVSLFKEYASRFSSSRFVPLFVLVSRRFAS